MYRTFDEFFASKFFGNDCKIFALASAEDPHTIEASMKAYEDGYAKPIMIGNADEIRSIMNDLGKSYEDIEIIDIRDGSEATARKAVELVNEGRADFIAKGLMDSSVVLKAMLKKDSGLNPGGFVSIVTLYELQKYHKMLWCTDVGLNMFPDLEGKKNMLKNVIGAAKDAGNPCPKVGVLCSIEKVNPKMPDTVDADALKKMYLEGEFGECIVEGPISYDLAICKESAEIKGYDSPVAGDADILLFPDITAANITLKALIRSEAALVASVTYGLKVPLAFASRSAPIDEKYRAIVLAASLCK